MNKYICILGADSPCQSFGGPRKRHIWKVDGCYLYWGGVGPVCWACGRKRS